MWGCDSEHLIIDRIIQAHLAVWTVACAVAFIVYYSKAEVRHNPRFEGQLHSLSGVIVHDKPLFGTLMCGFGGAVVVAVAGRITETCDWVGLLLLIAMFCGLLAVVNYDVRDYRSAHFASLAVVVGFGTWFVIWVDVRAWFVAVCYYVFTTVFVFMIVLNAGYTKWTPPFMTLQALTEIVWAVALCACVVAFAIEE